MDQKMYVDFLKNNFDIKVHIKGLRVEGLDLKSRIFYYNPMFKGVGKIRIITLSSKDKNIILDIYYVEDDFKGLYKGYFIVKPVTSVASSILYLFPKVSIDLSQYFYRLYKDSKVLKKYFISNHLQESILSKKEENMKRYIYEEVVKYPVETLETMFLRKDKIRKYIRYFLEMNKDCTKEVKTFLMHLLLEPYKKYVCLVNDTFKHPCIKVSHEKISAYPKEYHPYGYLEDAVSRKYTIFIATTFDFKGGDTIAKKSD